MAQVFVSGRLGHPTPATDGGIAAQRKNGSHEAPRQVGTRAGARPQASWLAGQPSSCPSTGPHASSTACQLRTPEPCPAKRLKVVMSFLRWDPGSGRWKSVWQARQGLSPVTKTLFFLFFFPLPVSALCSPAVAVPLGPAPNYTHDYLAPITSKLKILSN